MEETLYWEIFALIRMPAKQPCETKTHRSLKLLVRFYMLPICLGGFSFYRPNALYVNWKLSMSVNMSVNVLVYVLSQ